MSETPKGQDQLLDHNYDGIQEYNNPLPNWWLVTFYGTIIFAIFYFGYFQLGSGPSLADELKVAMQEQNALKPPAPAEPQMESEEVLTQKMGAPEVVNAGKVVFAEKCASCHGPQGQGLIGPNLTDNFWIHGTGTRQDIMKVVTTGVLDKGMPAWGTMMKPEEVLAASAFVYTLRGTNPPNPKPPQGNEVKN